MADGEDLIGLFWNDMMGLDPDDILVRPCPLHSGAKPHRATIARCNCGVVSCGSIEVEVTRSHGIVAWSWGSQDARRTIGFLAASYDAEVERALSDTTWETPDRTAARLLAGKVDQQVLAGHGLSYHWASGRIGQGTFTVSLMLEPGPYQVLLNLPWNEESPEGMASKCAKVLGDEPANWTQIEWFPLQADLGPPSLAGPGWRRGGA